MLSSLLCYPALLYSLFVLIYLMACKRNLDETWFAFSSFMTDRGSFTRLVKSVKALFGPKYDGKYLSTRR